MDAVVLALCCLFIGASGEWCCGDMNTKVQSQIKEVPRSRVIKVSQTEYYQAVTGYKPCPNNTISEGEIPKPGVGFGSEDTTENRKKLNLHPLAQLIRDGILGTRSKQYHSYCPVTATKTRIGIGYRTEYYLSAQFDDSKSSCPQKDLVCCKGFKQVGSNCIDESKAKDANDAFNFLKDLGIVG